MSGQATTQGPARMRMARPSGSYLLPERLHSFLGRTKEFPSFQKILLLRNMPGNEMLESTAGKSVGAPCPKQSLCRPQTRCSVSS